jgi:hypothetical protein
VYGGVDIQACSEERLLLATGEAQCGGGNDVHGGHGSGGLDLYINHGEGHGVHHEYRRSNSLGLS